MLGTTSTTATPSSTSLISQFGLLATPVTSEKKAMKILVVDDVKINVSLLIRKLSTVKNIKCSCVAAYDGVEAVAEAMKAKEANAPFDLILMDLNMGDMNGDKAAAIIRSLDITSPIVAVSTDIRSEEQAVANSMNDFLSKTPTVADLTQKLEKYSDKTSANIEQAVKLATVAASATLASALCWSLTQSLNLSAVSNSFCSADLASTEKNAGLADFMKPAAYDLPSVRC